MSKNTMCPLCICWQCVASSRKPLSHTHIHRDTQMHAHTQRYTLARIPPLHPTLSPNTSYTRPPSPNISCAWQDGHHHRRRKSLLLPRLPRDACGDLCLDHGLRLHGGNSAGRQAPRVVQPDVEMMSWIVCYSVKAICHRALGRGYQYQYIWVNKNISKHFRAVAYVCNPMTKWQVKRVQV